MLEVSKLYKVVLTVHDSIVCCVPDAEAEAAKAYVEECMREVPEWADLDCYLSIAKRVLVNHTEIVND
jgi:DNA polymerase I-like protein with 3'-5' exonuclease and polymerase domains